MKKITTLFLVALLSFATAGVWAKGHHKKHHRHDRDSSSCEGKHKRGGKHMKHMLKALNLTDAQKTKAKALKEKQKEAMKAQREKMRPMNENLRKLLAADKVDLAAVRKQLDDISKAHVESRMAGIQGRLDFEALLTKEQKQKLKDMHQKKMEHKGDKKNRRSKKSRR